MGFENVGRVWTKDSFTQYLSTIDQPEWCVAITLHHTGIPSLADRPNGFTVTHIENIRDYYIKIGWSAGPHLFIDEDQIFGMCDLRKKGIHAKSFNKMAIGIEVLGNYESEDPKNGRGLECWQTAAAAARSLLNWLDLEADEETILFHRDDPKTDKTCPGTKVTKDWVLELIAAPTAPQET
ncbi:MAG: peptidoglycan recognition family protein [Thermodesulfobacteriota bacterium]